jgi:hypothetical protein
MGETGWAETVLAEQVPLAPPAEHLVVMNP